MAVTADILFLCVFFLLMNRKDHERNQGQDTGFNIWSQIHWSSMGMIRRVEFVSQFLLLITSQLPSRLPARSPHGADNLELPSPQPQPSPSNTISESQPNNILDAKPDLEKELKKTLLSLCFGAALQIATQGKQVAESEINRSTISLLSLGTATIFASLFTSHFIGENMPNASRMLDKVAFFLAATTFFFAIATPCPLGIKCAIWAVYIISLIAIAACNFLLYSGGELRALMWRQVTRDYNIVNSKRKLRIVEIACYLNDITVEGFEEACGKHHPEEGQGAAGKALQSNGMHFNPVLSEPSVDDYPFVYHAWGFGLHAAVSFKLENIHMNRVDYVLEFFLPAETKEVSEHKLLIVGISSILQKNCRNSWVISSMESSVDNMDSVVGSEGAIFDRSLPASSNNGSFNENGMIIASDAVNAADHGIQIGVEAHEQVVF
ncbi:hypothetical protein SADUNF_Sadunf07G0114700 [Salix dunnii]|uniref:NLP1-9 GAF domain-containing protein n=1 Tax=Salix dunnii TaxID=1413687 RepID=A0A835K042_9ROSI|nr:hypothetical protein SADUNF_Sadunf07G0114700 [Salix dunnii]